MGPIIRWRGRFRHRRTRCLRGSRFYRRSPPGTMPGTSSGREGRSFPAGNNGRRRGPRGSRDERPRSRRGIRRRHSTHPPRSRSRYRNLPDALRDRSRRNQRHRLCQFPNRPSCCSQRQAAHPETNPDLASPVHATTPWIRSNAGVLFQALGGSLRAGRGKERNYGHSHTVFPCSQLCPTAQSRSLEQRKKQTSCSQAMSGGQSRSSRHEYVHMPPRQFDSDVQQTPE
jgi:hypothetical protein